MSSILQFAIDPMSIASSGFVQNTDSILKFRQLSIASNGYLVLFDVDQNKVINVNTSKPTSSSGGNNKAKTKQKVKPKTKPKVEQIIDDTDDLICIIKAFLSVNQ